MTAVGRSAAGWFGGASLVALLGSIGSEVGPTSILTGSIRGHLFISNPIPLLQSSSTTSTIVTIASARYSHTHAELKWPPSTP